MQTDASALQLVLGADPALLAIVGLSLTVSLAAVGIATLIGLPLGAAVALLRFPGREWGRFPSTPSSSAMAGDSSPARSGYIGLVTAPIESSGGVNWLTG